MKPALKILRNRFQSLYSPKLQRQLMKLIYEITVFPLISTLSLYLISNLLDEELIRGQRLKEGGTYFKRREIHHNKFQNFVFVFFNNENETQNLRTKKNNENITMSTIALLFKCLHNHTIWIHMNFSFTIITIWQFFL